MVKHLVLSGGGQTIFNYLGIFKELFDEKYININSIKSIFGTSSGSIIGAILCLKYDWNDIVDYVIRCPWETKLKIELQTAIRVFDTNGLYDENLFIQIFKPLLSGKHLSLEITLSEFYSYSSIDFHIYTFELNSFETIDISHKTHPHVKLLDAIRMSCSIPLLIRPICRDGECFVDGGIQMNYPIQPCLSLYPGEETEILGVKNFHHHENHEHKTNHITEQSNVSDYLHVFLHRCIKLMRSDLEPPKIPNEIHLYTQGISLEALMETLFDKQKRQRMMEDGTNTAKLFIKYTCHSNTIEVEE